MNSSTTTTRHRDTLITWAMSIGLFAVTLIVYASALDGVFLFDDKSSIVDNRSISAGIFDRGNTTSTRPLTQMSFAANYQVGKLDATVYHWTNNVIHSFAAVFLFLWLQSTFQVLVDRNSIENHETSIPDDAKAIAPRLPTYVAFAAALLWAVHPLNTQAVTYIVQRGESMMGMFFFLFMFALSQTRNESQFKRLFQIIAVLAFAGGVGSKQVMVTAFPIAMLYSRYFLAESWVDSFKSRPILWIGLSMLLAVGTVAALPIVFGGEAGVGLQIEEVSWWQYLLTQPSVILHYFRLVLWPQPLILDYGWIPEESLAKILLTSSALLAVVAFSTWKIWRGRTVWLLPIAALIVLLPTSSFIPFRDLAFEHRMYVPAALLMAAALWLAAEFVLIPKRASLLSIAGAWVLVVVLATAGTVDRNRVYWSEVGMWKDVLAKTVERGREHLLVGRLYNNLGNALADSEEWEESIDALEKSLNHDSFSGHTFANLTRAYLATGSISKAKSTAEKALKLQPQNARVRQQIGLIFAAEGKINQAIEHFRIAAELAPTDVIILTNLALAYSTANLPQQSLEIVTRVLELQPENQEAQRRKISNLATLGRMEEALQAAEAYLRNHPDDPNVLFMLARIQLGKGQVDAAQQTLERCVAQKQVPPGANLLLGNMHRQLGQPRLAQDSYERELQNDARNVEALNNLAGLIAETDPRRAIDLFERLLTFAPSYHQASYNVAALQVRIGQTEAAAERLEKLLAVTDFPPARELLHSLQASSKN